MMLARNVVETPLENAIPIRFDASADRRYSVWPLFDAIALEPEMEDIAAPQDDIHFIMDDTGSMFLYVCDDGMVHRELFDAARKSGRPMAICKIENDMIETQFDWTDPRPGFIRHDYLHQVDPEVGWAMVQEVLAANEHLPAPPAPDDAGPSI